MLLFAAAFGAFTMADCSVIPSIQLANGQSAQASCRVTCWSGKLAQPTTRLARQHQVNSFFLFAQKSPHDDNDLMVTATSNYIWPPLLIPIHSQWLLSVATSVRPLDGLFTIVIPKLTKAWWFSLYLARSEQSANHSCMHVSLAAAAQQLGCARNIIAFRLIAIVFVVGGANNIVSMLTC